MSRAVDCLIIGQGLAGSILAWTLIHDGCRVMVVDDGDCAAASRVAAGILNPLAGRKLQKNQRCEVFLSAAEETYEAIEQLLGRRFLHRRDILRLFTGAAQRQMWEERCADPTYVALLGLDFPAGTSGHALADPLGGFRTLRSGFVDTAPLLCWIRDWLDGWRSYRHCAFSHADLALTASGVAWRDIVADRVVFCEGHRVRFNPWFRWLPMAPVKGEILTVAMDEPLPWEIVIKSHWVVPIGDDRYRLGATWSREVLDERPTEAGRNELLAALSELYASPLTPRVIAHRAGVRPASADRRPLIGPHPHLPRLMVFNGFGARGTLTIPWYAQRFSDWLLRAEPLPPEADLKRWVDAAPIDG